MTTTAAGTSQRQAAILTRLAHALPEMVRLGEVVAPKAPADAMQTGVDWLMISDLALKLAHTVPHLTTEWAAAQLRLPMHLVADVLQKLQEDRMLETLGQEGAFNYRYTISQLGREWARRLLEVSGYIGPVPVSLAAYSAMLDWQLAQLAPVTLDAVRSALSPMVLPEHAVEVAALAASSGRSLFLFGPPGNGKTMLGRLLHDVFAGELWIPYAISIDSHVIRVFDRECHEVVDDAADSNQIDRRWIRIRRPLMVAGGEMTFDELDLAYSESLRFYEAPPHVKANGGMFFIDDFGRQRVDPHQLLNRWIIPLEQNVDHLTLNTGQKIQIPFRLMLVVATNLSVGDVADPAFLRRMGYRLRLDMPSEESYIRIFERYAAGSNASIDRATVARIVQRYRAEGRELRASEPRDLIERARDICRLHHRSLALSDDVIALAWRGYFGEADA